MSAGFYINIVPSDDNNDARGVIYKDMLDDALEALDLIHKLRAGGTTKERFDSLREIESSGKLWALTLFTDAILEMYSERFPQEYCDRTGTRMSKSVIVDGVRYTADFEPRHKLEKN